MPRKNKLDNQDHEILNQLLKDASITNRELAKRVKLSPSATLERVKKLKEQDYIVRSNTEINFRKLGYNYHALLIVRLPPDHIKKLMHFMEDFTEFIRYWVCPIENHKLYPEMYFVIEARFIDEERFSTMWHFTIAEHYEWFPVTAMRIEFGDYFPKGGFLP